MKTFIKTILIGAIITILAPHPAYAKRSFKGVIKKPCQTMLGIREYTAIYVRGLKDEAGVSGCKKTSLKINGRMRKPTSCRTKLGLTTASFWVEEASCGRSLTPPTVQPPVLERINPISDDSWVSQTFRKILEGTVKNASNLGTGLTTTDTQVHERMKLGYKDLRAQTDIQNLEVLATSFAEYFKKGTPRNAAFKSALNANDQEAMMSLLMGTPGFQQLVVGACDSGFKGAITFGFGVDVSAGVTGSGEFGIAIGKQCQKGELPDQFETWWEARRYITGTYGFGMTLGGDAAIGIGFWKKDLSNLEGPVLGIIGGATVKVGATVGVFWEDFLKGESAGEGLPAYEGFAVMPSAGLSGELEFVKSHYKDLGLMLTTRKSD